MESDGPGSPIHVGHLPGERMDRVRSWAVDPVDRLRSGNQVIYPGMNSGIKKKGQMKQRECPLCHRKIDPRGWHRHLRAHHKKGEASIGLLLANGVDVDSVEARKKKAAMKAAMEKASENPETQDFYTKLAKADKRVLLKACPFCACDLSKLGASVEVGDWIDRIDKSVERMTRLTEIDQAADQAEKTHENL